MKKTLVLVASIFLVYCSYAQELKDKNVPTILKSSLKSKYPEATTVKWEKEDKMYEASFKLNNIDNSLLMDSKGNILESEAATEMAKLPQTVLVYVKNKYAGKKPKGAAIITDSKGKITYEVEMNGTDLIFDNKGNFLKKVKA